MNLTQALNLVSLFQGKFDGPYDSQNSTTNHLEFLTALDKRNLMFCTS